MTTSSADLSSLRIDRDRKRSGGGGPFLPVVLFIAALGAGLFFLRGVIFNAPVAVRVAMAEKVASGDGTVRSVEILTANGYVVPRRKASVSSEVGGRLAALYVEEGDTASAGTVLGMLRNDDQKAQVAAARADLNARKAGEAAARATLDLARQEFERQKEMLAQKLVSQAAFDIAQATLNVSEAGLKSATADIAAAEAQLTVAAENLEKTYIRAPFTGTVLRKEAEVGEIVTPIPSSGGLTRGAIVTMADLESSEMEVDVNEGYITRVVSGQKAEVELDAYAGVRFPAHVRQVVPTADRQKATVQVKVAFDAPDPRILPEMGGKVYFLDGGAAATGSAGPGTAVLVPSGAVRQANGRSVVYIIVGEKARLQPVEPAGPVGEKVRISAGLAGGERVVIEGPETLKDGDRVKVEGGTDG